MKKLNSIKLNGLNKSNLELREMSHIYGGNYCAFGDDNLKANEGQGKCSCYCSFSFTCQSDYVFLKDSRKMRNNSLSKLL